MSADTDTRVENLGTFFEKYSDGNKTEITKLCGRDIRSTMKCRHYNSDKRFETENFKTLPLIHSRKRR